VGTCHADPEELKCEKPYVTSHLISSCL
jgi:hypothetical protein